MGTYASPDPLPVAPTRSGTVPAAPADGAAPLGLSTTRTSDTKSGDLWISGAYLRASRCRAGILTRANLLNLQLSESGAAFWCAFLTLTYARDDDWSALHITAFNKRAREYLSRRGVGFAYVWCAELQQRGAVHFHELVFLPNGTMLPKPDQQGWWPHGSTQIAKARNAVSYIAKYAGKMITAGKFPRGLRLTGAGGLNEYSRAHARYVSLPGYVRRAFPFGSPISRALGGGFVNLHTGEVVRGEYEFVSRSNGAYTFRKRVSGAMPLHAERVAVRGPRSGGRADPPGTQDQAGRPRHVDAWL